MTDVNQIACEWYGSGRVLIRIDRGTFPKNKLTFIDTKPPDLNTILYGNTRDECYSLHITPLGINIFGEDGRLYKGWNMPV